MELSAVVAQFPVDFVVERNLRAMLEILAECRPGALVVFPEGALSGYADDPHFLDGLSMTAVTDGLRALQRHASGRDLHVWSFAHLRRAGGGRRAEQGIERVCPWT